MAHTFSRALRGQVRRHYKQFSLVSDVVVSPIPQTALCSTSTTSSPALCSVVSEVVARLSEASVPEPELSAQYLVSYAVTPAPRINTPVFANDWTKIQANSLNQEQADTLDRLVQCRLARMPVQYLLGNWDFHNITIQVRPPVFIPRPETEELVDLVLSSLPPPVPGKILHLLEIGPGSGAVSLAILAARQDLQVTCVERSLAAVELTRHNATLLGLRDKVKVVHGKVVLGTKLEELVEKYDLVFSNPPYILRKDLPSLAPEIFLYEDLRAVDGGAEGLDVILPIIEIAEDKLESGGMVILEVDPCHPHILPSKLSSLATSFVVDQVKADIRGNDRFMVLRKS